MISCHPFYALSHKWSAKRYVIPTIIFSIAYNLPKFFELKTGKVYNTISNSTEYILEATKLRLNYEYFFFYTIWMNFVLMGLVPFMMITILNSLTVHQVIKQMRLFTGSAKNTESHNVINDERVETSRAPFLAKRQKSPKIKASSTIDTLSESKLTIISTIISIVFVICHGIRWIPNTFELIQISHPDFEEDHFKWPLWIENISIVSHFLITLNSSINFYVYYVSRIKEVGTCLTSDCLTSSRNDVYEIDPSTNASRIE